MKRTMVSDTADKVGEEVLLKGWVNTRRDHGKITFIDLRDISGIAQIVFVPGNDAYEKANELRPEFVVEISGKVNARPENMVNPKLETGKVEIEAKSLAILNPSKTPPFAIDEGTHDVNEEVRLKYRYLDLRTERMKNNIILRHKVEKFIIDWMSDHGFFYLETPDLTKGTPEGAREYVIPSRLHPGNFYVLPQSPQQFKQLLMVAGFERYFQIARCFRDEDQRGDRQPEFTQLDVEMSFLDQEEILQLMEQLVVDMVKEILPNYRLTKVPFPRFTYQEVMDKYHTDKPDLRENKDDSTELAFAWIVDFPLFKHSTAENKLVSSHHPFTMPHQEDLAKLDKDPLQVRSYAYDLALNGYEVAGGSIRIHQKDIQDKIFKLLGISDDEKEKRFGHLLEAFEYGAPPHGGIAFGLDRLVAVYADEPNIREIIPFPKTGDARDLMMGAPSPIPRNRLKEAHIDVIGKEAEASEAQALDEQTDLVE